MGSYVPFLLFTYQGLSEALHLLLGQVLHLLHSLGCSLDCLQFAYIILVLRCQKFMFSNWSLIEAAFTQIMYTNMCHL